MILSFLASCCLARPPDGREILGEVHRWLGVQQSGLFERRLSDIMGVHRYVGFHFDQQQQGSTSGTFDNTFGRASIEMPREWRARSDFLVCGVAVP